MSIVVGILAVIGAIVVFLLATLFVLGATCNFRAGGNNEQS